MSRRTPRSAQRPLDRRVRRTRERLESALIGIVAERGYARTRLSDVLGRADVGRSTFYAHYGDKDALFESTLAGLERELRRRASEAAGEQLLPFTRPMLDHVAAHAALGSVAAIDPVLLSRLRRMLVRIAHDDLARRATSADVPVALLAEHAIGSLLALMIAWVAAPRGRDAAAIDALYRSLVVPGLVHALEG